MKSTNSEIYYELSTSNIFTWHKEMRYFHLVRKLLWLRFLRIGFVLPVFEGNSDILKIIKKANSEVLIFRCLLSLLVRNDTAEFEALMTIYFEDITKNISPDN